MRAAFFGTPDVAAVALRALLESDHEAAVVVTQPDRARGRGRGVTPSPVKEIATAQNIPVLQPQSPKEEGFADELRAHAPEVLAVVAYGHILPRAVLEVAPALNAHFSLLPRYRGAAPVQRALMDGATETGVSVFLLEPTVDTGPVIARAAVAIEARETAGELLARLAPIGARLLVEAIGALASGTAEPQPQDGAEASPAPKIVPEETEIDWSKPAREIANRVRALSPRPGAHTTFRGRRLVVLRAAPAEAPGVSQGETQAETPAETQAETQGAPGEIVDGESFVVAAGVGAVRLEEVTPEGKRAMAGADFARGARPQRGERLGGAQGSLG
jgi:methionyl-tRNA formyltransferase